MSILADLLRLFAFRACTLLISNKLHNNRQIFRNIVIADWTQFCTIVGSNQHCGVWLDADISDVLDWSWWGW